MILLSQILNYDDSADGPQWNPGIDVPYGAGPAHLCCHRVLPQASAYPTFSARTLPCGSGAVRPGHANASALAEGSQLPEATRQAIAEKIHQYTGLPVAYILKANLRVNVGEFNHNLQGSDDLTTGRLDSRFSGPTIDPLAEEAAYDPQATAISSAYISGFNDYVRRQLKFGEGLTYLPEVGLHQRSLGGQA